MRTRGAPAARSISVNPESHRKELELVKLVYSTEKAGNVDAT
jgi:hypothetical protein